MNVARALVRQIQRSIWICLDLFAPLFASRQKAENQHKRSFRFRKVLDDKKLYLVIGVNLSSIVLEERNRNDL